MTTYAFRLRFHLDNGHRILHDGETLEIDPGNGPVTMRALGKPSIGEAEKLVVTASGFATEKDAYSHGRQTRDALLLSGVRLRMGIHMGNDRASSSAGRYFIEKTEELGGTLHNDVHGLMVYPDVTKAMFFRASGSGVVGTPSKMFLEAIKGTAGLAGKLSESQRLAAEVYGLSHFETSPRARFITLITAVECLAERQRLPEYLVKHVDGLVKSTHGLATNEETMPGAEDGNVFRREIARLASQVGSLKNESIGGACERLIGQHLGNEEAERFAYWYQIRSDLVHKGKVDPDVNVGDQIPDLDETVSKLLLKAASAPA